MLQMVRNAQAVIVLLSKKEGFTLIERFEKCILMIFVFVAYPEQDFGVIFF